MNFYIIRTAESDRRFIYASGYGPLSEPMNFLSPQDLENKVEFWKVNQREPGIITGERGSKWPDFLRNGGSPPLMFVSQRIVESLHNSGIPIARSTPMPIAKIKAKNIKDKPAPEYSVVEALPGIEMDYEASGISIDSEGKPIIPRTIQPIPWKLKSSTWTGLDLFGWPRIPKRPDEVLICTDRVVELAKRDGWTNVKFESIAAV